MCVCVCIFNRIFSFVTFTDSTLLFTEHINATSLPGNEATPTGSLSSGKPLLNCIDEDDHQYKTTQTGVALKSCLAK